MMKIQKTYIIISEAREDLDNLKSTMFDLKELHRSRIFGVFNGQLYVCYVHCKNKDDIEIY